MLIGRGRDAERAKAAEAGLDYVYVGWRHVSAKHFRIVKKPGDKWYIEKDPTSKNGVHYNDEPLPTSPNRPVQLTDGDHVHLVNVLSASSTSVQVSYVFKLGEGDACAKAPKFDGRKAACPTFNALCLERHFENQGGQGLPWRWPCCSVHIMERVSGERRIRARRGGDQEKARP